MRGLLLLCKKTDDNFKEGKTYQSVKLDNDICQISLGRNKKKIELHYYELGKTFHVYDDDYEVNPNLFNIKDFLNRKKEEKSYALNVKKTMYVIQREDGQYYSSQYGWDEDFNKAYLFKTEKSASSKIEALDDNTCRVKEAKIIVD